jgi:hypothetical protein
LNLGKHISRLGRSPRLLHASLHNVFNAAVILQLHQLLVDSQDKADESGISFAIAAFESEARNGNIYAEDCTRVLLDLNLLVQKLRSQALFGGQHVETSNHPTELQDQASPYTNIYPITPGASRTYGWNTQDSEQTAALNNTVDEHDPAYQELMTWLNVDDLQLYNI